MIVNAHHGAKGMNVKFTITEALAMRIPSQRAPARSRKDPEACRETDKAADQVRGLRDQDIASFRSSG